MYKSVLKVDLRMDLRESICFPPLAFFPSTFDVVRLFTQMLWYSAVNPTKKTKPKVKVLPACMLAENKPAILTVHKTRFSAGVNCAIAIFHLEGPAELAHERRAPV